MQTLSDEQSLSHYGRDWTRFWPARPSKVVFPETVDEVVELVRQARADGQALVPSGGRTGLSGGAVAAHGEVVVSMERMRKLIEVDEFEPSICVQAGMTVGAVQTAAAEHGLFYPVDWAAAASSQVGGSIATNAGGIRVLRYGMTREWVRGLKVVTGTGELLELNRGLIKNNTGMDLRQLMIGSEGTLGIIVEATLGLLPTPPEASVLLLGFSGLDALMPALAELRQGLSLSAFEFFDRRCIDHVEAALGRGFPLDADACPYYAVVEFEDPGQQNQEAALARFEALMEAGHVLDGTLSQSGAQAEELWAWREAISESIAPRTPYKNDLSVRISRVPAFLEALDALVRERYPDFEVLWFGHIGDGNLHMNVLRPEDWSTEDFHAAGRELSPAVFELVQRYEGSVSAEHGVGLLKRDDLHWSRSETEIELMRAIKRQFDPDGILNPGKVLPG
ncbi:FAD-binding oxidoreductase [Wenzhouxiangella marina]|uniref:FAD linked oxidase, C-terminal domain protein n=1 Tax=Wenzhouxiangella marina TaxID=1579979 RepID=A0A0K0XWR8_9GAMM|nr:FAD-binding oxidoreductase [Wenzhouxiangella marina]AKS42061.1 FAD linked oxidase, C-terminal domain protein [Wenzhouxiangella marina]MBB6086170.1 FAD/FMN-containing dehydrogenase [Wenzhouxiangella marina]